MIGNIIDRRKRQYRWALVTVILEPTWHDNNCDDADKTPKGENEGIGYKEYPKTSITEAITAAHALSYLVTMYIYDLGEDIQETKRGKEL